METTTPLKMLIPALASRETRIAITRRHSSTQGLQLFHYSNAPFRCEAPLWYRNVQALNVINLKAIK